MYNSRDIAISTHTSLAGRDFPKYLIVPYPFGFLLTRPSRDVTNVYCYYTDYTGISTHTSLAGRDTAGRILSSGYAISTHTSLAGRDDINELICDIKNISTHTSLAGRDFCIG